MSSQKFETYVHNLISNPYGKVINSITLTLMKFYEYCSFNVQSPKETSRKIHRTIIGGIIGSVIGGIVGGGMESKQSIELKVGIGAIAGMTAIGGFGYKTDYTASKTVKAIYSSLSDYLMKISFNLGMGDLRHNLYISQTTPYIKNIQAMKHLYYWCYYAFLVYEKIETIEYMLGATEKNGQIIHGNRYIESIFKPKFFVYVDHTSLSIVIAIRGTSSTSDAITDSVGNMIPPVRFSENPEFLAHKGFYEAAINVLENVLPQLEKIVVRHPNYNIKVVGHSYGAGVASIVTWGLEKNRQENLLKTEIPVRGILYACPPVFNEEASNETCSMLATVFLGWDIIPCASSSNFFKFICNPDNTEEKCSISNDLNDKSLMCPCYVPGTIYWITYNEETRECSEVYLISKRNDRLQNIIIHERMDDDHSIVNIYVYLLAVIKKHEL